MIESQFKTAVHVVIIGASGHARVIADIIRCSGDVVDGFLDDRSSVQFPSLTVLGSIDDARALANDNPSLRFVVGIGDNRTRKDIVKRLGGLCYYTAVHPSAVIARDVVISEGSVVMANVVVNTGSTIGRHCIINTAATVDHDCSVKDYVHLSPGVHLSGAVSIEHESWIGVGAVVSCNVKICGDCVIGAGAVVIRDISLAGTYVGIPAKKNCTDS